MAWKGLKKKEKTKNTDTCIAIEIFLCHFEKCMDNNIGTLSSYMMQTSDNASNPIPYTMLEDTEV